jgi:hypothetical protein
MSEPKQKDQTFLYVVHKLEDGKRCGFVDDTPKAVSAPDECDARMRIAARLAKAGTYDPDDPKVEVEILGPFGK